MITGAYIAVISRFRCLRRLKNIKGDKYYKWHVLVGHPDTKSGGDSSTVSGLFHCINL